MEDYKNFDLYKDIKLRCNGEIYIGVLGPVRTGKSTFIKRFMENLVLPGISDEHEKSRAIDEMPQSATGKTIMTTEPKFIPKEAATVKLSEDIQVKVRLIDCVGYMVEGASGHMEEEKERMVKTPWFAEEIPFTKAAEIGTDKVMREHSTIGIVITTDGSFGELSRKNYLIPEEKTIAAMKATKKPFVVLLNTNKPYQAETKALCEEISAKYGVSTLPVNCEQLSKEDVVNILKNVLFEFPIRSISFKIPCWVESLPIEHEIKKSLISGLKEIMKEYSSIKDIMYKPMVMENPYVSKVMVEKQGISDGEVVVNMEMVPTYYYQILSEMVGEKITDDYALITMLKNYTFMKNEYTKVADAMDAVHYKGYGVVMPARDEITLSQPEVIRHSGKFGVKIKASSPSVHMIRANIETEIAPIVGSEKQAEDLMKYLQEAENQENSIWDVNIFGKTVEQLVSDGITTKITTLGEECQLKLQDTMQKVVNDSNGGIVCIII
ncbi:MAG: stage IV sporulation protein A [Lachnospiraceae bacterium]|nr:stage IV sporulation protein A [Lachnospiraceae bacterium]